MDLAHNLAYNLKQLRTSLPPHIKLVAVTKQRTLSEIEEAIMHGIEDIGENRIQEAKEKLPHLKNRVTRHLIGHLQTNKVKIAVKLFDMIQSVDSLKLAEKLNEAAANANKIMPILIQVNIGNEAQKFGFPLDDLFCPIKTIGEKMPHLKVKGLMAIAPYHENSENVRPYFRRMKELFEGLKLTTFPNIQMEELSMGMSHDYHIAIEEGATMIRIGRAIFEE